MAAVECCCTAMENWECVAVGIVALAQNKACRAVTIISAFLVIFIVGIDSFRPHVLLSDGNDGAVEHWKVQQKLFSAKGVGWIVENKTEPVHSTLFYTKGELFSMHLSGHTHDGKTEERVTSFTNTLLAVRTIWEVRSYVNTCNFAPKGAEKDGRVPVYPLARMTKHFFTLYSRFSVERYNCDGSLSEVWDIVPRYWLSYLYHWDVQKPSIGHLVGTIDEKGSFFRHTYQAKILGTEDTTLFAHAIFLAASSRGKSSGGGSGSSGSGGDGGNLRGGGVSAR